MESGSTRPVNSEGKKLKIGRESLFRLSFLWENYVYRLSIMCYNNTIKISGGNYMSIWMRTREYQTTLAMEDRMIAILHADEEAYEDMEKDIKNNTFITSVYTDLLVTELDLTDEQWKESLSNCRKIINNYYKKVFTRK